MSSSNTTLLASAFYSVLGDETLSKFFYRILGEEIFSRTNLRESLCKAFITDLHNWPSDRRFSYALARAESSGMTVIQRDAVFSFYLSNTLETILSGALQIDKSLSVSLRNVFYDALISSPSLKAACITALTKIFSETTPIDRILSSPLETTLLISNLANAPLESTYLLGDIVRNVIFQNPAILAVFCKILRLTEGGLEQSAE